MNIISYEYEKDDEEEPKKPSIPPLRPPSMPPPTVPPPTMPPPSIPPISPPPTTPAPSYPTYEPKPSIPSGPSQAEYNAAISQVQERDTRLRDLEIQLQNVNTQFATLNAQVHEKDHQINQLTSKVQNLQATIETYQNQINQLNNEKAQLQAQLPQLQGQLQRVQQENMNLQQQIGPLQSQINKLQEELTYKERRIQELKEPKPVMPSSLAQGITSQTSTFGSSPSFGTSAGPTSTPSQDVGVELGGTRRICPNCGASGFAIKEVEDKTKIISYIPKPQYAKKNVCTKCGFEF
ncbi:MAG: hypothetical protein ACFFDX_01280 [Candidatus Odinarchaeota archaeon]